MSKNKPNKRSSQQAQPNRHAQPPTPRLAPENGVSGHPNEDRPLTLTPEGLQRLRIARDQLAQQLRERVEKIEKIKRDAEAQIERLAQEARQFEKAIDQQDGGIQTMELLLSGLPENHVEIDRTPLPGRMGPSVPAAQMSPPATAIPVGTTIEYQNGNGAYDDLAEGPEDWGKIGL